MNFFIGITDQSWFDSLSSLPSPDEVNFWQPSGKTTFRALKLGELFLFKLHSPNDYIVGGGFFAHSTLLPISLAWMTDVNYLCSPTTIKIAFFKVFICFIHQASKNEALRCSTIHFLKPTQV